MATGAFRRGQPVASGRDVKSSKRGGVEGQSPPKRSVRFSQLHDGDWRFSARPASRFGPRRKKLQTLRRRGTVAATRSVRFSQLHDGDRPFSARPASRFGSTPKKLQTFRRIGTVAASGKPVPRPPKSLSLDLEPLQPPRERSSFAPESRAST
jgi:hypothetical protein